MQTYQEFLQQKRIVDKPSGFDPRRLNQSLYPFQRDITRWAIRRGRAAIFEDCGLGKSLQQLEWSSQIANYTGKPVLILTPPSVREQTAQEGERFSIPCAIANGDEDISGKGVFISNYEKLHRFDCSRFSGVALDESSILKSFDGKTRNQLIDGFARTPYKSAWTATPAPNDYMELGNHAEFLGAMTRSEMLSMFFVHDGGDTAKWRLKGHARADYWRWLCSFAVNIRKPSDLGYDDGEFVLPPLRIHEHLVDSSAESAGFLFAMPVSTLQERRSARRGSIDERCQTVADLARAAKGKVLVWCDLNDEQRAVSKLLGDAAVSIEGSTPEDDRTALESDWRAGAKKCLVSKSSIFGWGMNWQHCDTVIYCGLSDSYESFYQSIRRCWRFGQRRPVNAHIVISQMESAVLQNIKPKQLDAERMAQEMIAHMAPISSSEIQGTARSQTNYNPEHEMKIPSWLRDETLCQQEAA